MHYLYRYVCILNVFFYMCIWTIVCNKEFILLLYVALDIIKVTDISTYNNEYSIIVIIITMVTERIFISMGGGVFLLLFLFDGGLFAIFFV